jgi:predicted metal-binding membrane protein
MGSSDRVEQAVEIARPPAEVRTAMTTAQMVPVLAVVLGLAAACWVIAVRQMTGMDMGVATQLGSFAFFVGMWVPMMAAMMLPGTAPAVAIHTRGRLRAVPLFVVLYLAVWTLFGLAVYVLYRPHGTVAAGVVAIAAGAYELTPLKRHFRRRCYYRDSNCSGFMFGLYCVGSTVGLMLMQIAFGIMSVTWMVVVAVLASAQKLLPAKTAIDVPLALAIAGLGLVILIAPSLVPGLTPPMM